MNINPVDLSVRNILIIDSNTEECERLRVNLSKHGYQVQVINQGEIARQVVPVLLPDLVLLAINLPDTNGFEVCTFLKAKAESRDIPVIFISDKYESSELLKAFSNGGIDYIAKPWIDSELLARIEAQISAYGVQKQLHAQNQLLQEEITSRISIEKSLEQHNQLLQNEINNRLAIESSLKEQNQLLKKQIKTDQDSNFFLQKSKQSYWGKINLSSLNILEKVQQMIEDLESSTHLVKTLVESSDIELDILIKKISQNCHNLHQMIQELREVLQIRDH